MFLCCVYLCLCCLYAFCCFCFVCICCLLFCFASVVFCVVFVVLVFFVLVVRLDLCCYCCCCCCCCCCSVCCCLLGSVRDHHRRTCLEGQQCFISTDLCFCLLACLCNRLYSVGWLTLTRWLQPRATDFGLCNAFIRLEATVWGATISSHEFWILSCIHLSGGCSLEATASSHMLGVSRALPCLESIVWGAIVKPLPTQSTSC